MRSAPRAVLLAVPAGVVVAAAWLRLAHPLVPLWRPAAVVALALAAAAAPRRWPRAAASVVASVVAAQVALGVWLLPLRPLDPLGGFGLGGRFAALAHRFHTGLADYYGTQLPFDPHLHAEMAEVALAAVFCFTLAVALLAAAGLPVAAALGLVLGAGWPATLLGPSHGIEVGAAILAAGLVLLARPGSRRPALVVPAAVVVLLAAVTVGSAAAAGHGLVRWQNWDPLHGSTVEVGADFVWRAQYGGIRWPAHATVLLRVASARQPRFLRAGVFDDFTGDAWVEGDSRAADALEPAAAFRTRNESREVVTVEALSDTHLVGGSIPIRYETGSVPIVEPWPGFGELPSGLFRGLRYTVWSYVPQPTAADLAGSAPDYPAELELDGLFNVGDGVNVLPFGAPNRDRWVGAELAGRPQLAPYLPLFKQAERVAGNARTPYDAVAALEHWFLDGPFRYSDDPQVVRPALVGFVTTTHAGYCQYFAGAMALMLRYLGVPARVAVGFWGGTKDPNSHGHTWVVTDRDAHAWVEVWFRGYGWIPFDPTPPALGFARHPAVPGTTSGAAAGGEPRPVPGLSRVGPAGGSAGTSSGARRGGPTRRRPVRSAPEPGAAGSHGGAGKLAVLALLLAVVGGAGALVLTKRVIRGLRRLERDPRRIGAGCRLELTEFLADHRVDTEAGATVHELGEVVRREFGVDARDFVRAVAAARFDRDERAGAAAAEARRELRDVLDTIRRGLTLRERMAGLLSLRSLSRARAVDAFAAPGSTGS